MSKVLVVDDEKLIVKGIKFSLEKFSLPFERGMAQLSISSFLRQVKALCDCTVLFLCPN